MPLPLYNKLAKILRLVIAIALIIHFGFKDYFYWSSLIFYAFPLPVILGFSLLLIFLEVKLYRGITIIISIIIAILWLSESYRFNNAYEESDKGFEVVFWNAFHSRNFQDAFEENNGLPDVFVMVESDSVDVEEISKNHPEYYFFKSETNISIFSKTVIEGINQVVSKNGTTVLNFKTSGISFYAVDLSPNLFNFRKHELEYILSQIKNEARTIVVGDFNTPLNSVHFKKFKEDFDHALYKKGRGFVETWFWNIPILSLDHIWVSKDLEALNANKIKTIKSDHCILSITIKNKTRSN